LKPLGFDNSFAMAVRGEDARKLGLETLSDAAGKKTDWRLGVGYEFQQRPDGLPALMKTYELRLKAAPQSMDLGLLYKALIDRQVDMIAANGTDGLLSTLDVKVLRDDRSAFPPYEAALVMREDPNRPTLPAVLEELSGKFTDETMRKLNYEVDGKHRRVEAVAAEFLQQAGLR
jgi:osmoprotectant transport system substrate-binding protein